MPVLPFASAAAAREFISAGNAHFTLKSAKTGTHFTFRARLSEDKKIFFVGVLTGPDNSNSYTYLGTMRRGVYFHGVKSKISAEAPSAKAFAWAWAHLVKDQMPAALQVFHASRCGRCARALTHPESIQSGYGPECQSKVGGFFAEAA